MHAILSVTVPFFALVLAGWLAARQRLLPGDAVPGLNAFVLYFALPCMLFRFGMNTPVLELLNPWVLLVYLLCQALVVWIAVALARRQGVDLKNAAFGALVAAFPNTGFMGVPLLVALLGASAAGPVISTILADLFFTSSLCIALSQWHARQAGGAADANANQGARQAALRALRSALSNPLPWAIALGALASLASQRGFRLPGPLDRGVAMLADAASPVALFTIGAMLWRSGQTTAAAGGAGIGTGSGANPRPAGPPPWAQVWPPAAIKLLLHPALVGGAAWLAQHLGVPLTPQQALVLVLAAALPSASNVSLLTERYGADSGRVARIIMASTVAAFGSFSLIAWGLGVQAA